VADRNIFPLDQAEPEDQGFHRKLTKRSNDVDLCGLDRLFAIMHV
jgi:hypothetical protein